jgi:HTH-type transcriptional regulator / antitoxin HigA
MATPKQNQYEPTVVFHPGKTLAEKLTELSMGPKEFAVRTGKPEKTILAIIKGESRITPEMAVNFEFVTRIPAHFWHNKQKIYDDYLARKVQSEAFDKAKDWAKSFPYADMAKLGWIETTKDWKEQIHHLLNFFQVSNQGAWEELHFNSVLKVDFRISLKHTKAPFAIAAWLQHGKLAAQQMEIATYDEKALEKALTAAQSLMVQQPSDLAKQLVEICANCGVKLVYSACIKGAPINGATRWLGDTPLIQLSARYKRNDIFWFTFFHEVGHIMLHGKKDIFLEKYEYTDLDEKKEDQADQFAVNWTFKKEHELEVTLLTSLSENDIPILAKKYYTHPAMIVGRLRRLNLVNPAFGAKFLVEIEIV